ncbi:MAG TPA: hypothetical protein P5550_08390 [Bacteroidales bacterium]|nr:hypothetical protein [Bacteroidales bacterium]
MSQDHLERFIRDHRPEFDDQLPDPGVWDRIRSGMELQQRRTLPWKTYLVRVAAVLLIFALSWLVHDMVDQYVPAGKGPEQGAISAQAEELFEAEAFYTQQIQTMQEEVFLLTRSEPEVQHDIRTELSELDSVYADLKRDLRDDAANEEIIAAMIQNYRLKIAILTDILEQLQESRSGEGKEVRHEI